MLPNCGTISALFAHRGSLLINAASRMLFSKTRPICQELNACCSPARISGSNLKMLRAEIAALDKSLAAAEEQRRDLERQAAEKRTQQLKALPEVRLHRAASQRPPLSQICRTILYEWFRHFACLLRMPSEGSEPRVLLPDGSVAWLSRRRGQGAPARRPARRPRPGATTRQPGRPRTRRRSGWTWTPSPRSRRLRAPSLRTTRPRCRRRGHSVQLPSQQHSFLQSTLRSHARVLSRALRTVQSARCAMQEDHGCEACLEGGAGKRWKRCPRQPSPPPQTLARARLR